MKHSAHYNPEVIASVAEVALTYFGEAQFPTPEVKNIVAMHLRNYIAGTIPFNVLENNVKQVISNTEPLQHLKSIIEIGQQPIPENPISSQNGNDSESKRKKSRPWSQYEDDRLIAGIMRCGIENWTSISRFVGNGRTKSQCSQRWYRGLDPKISKMQWSQAEEDLLIHLISIHGSKAWTTISSQMKNRSDVQCRYKYKQLVKEKRIHSGSIPAISPLTQAVTPPTQNSPAHQVYVHTPAYTPQFVQPMYSIPIIPPETQTYPGYPGQMICIPPMQSLAAIKSSTPPQPTTPILTPPQPQSHLLVQSPNALPSIIREFPQIENPRPALPHVQPFFEHASPLQPSPHPQDIHQKKVEKESFNADHVDNLHHSIPPIEAPAINAKLYSVY